MHSRQTLLRLLFCLPPCLVRAQDGAPFDPGCSVPFPDALHHPIDDDCGIEGKSSAADKRVESRAKNNLCATGPSTWVTLFTFRKLKEAAEKPGFHLGADRSGARNVWVTNPAGATIGEGSLVKFSAFVIRADTANRSGGENVNCSRGGTPRNDIHIHLAPSPSKEKANFCAAIGAEISPHLRPDSLNSGDLMLTDGRPVRVTGQLFFDNNHPAKCDLKTPANSRASTWEIHPTYSVEVCKFATLATCDARKDDVWVRMPEWVTGQEADDEP